MNEDALSEFRSITGAPSHVAQGFLQMTGDDVMQAVQLYYDNPELQSSFSELATGPSASSGVSGAGPRASGAGFSASISPRSRSRQRTTTSRRTGTGDGRGSFPYASSSSRHHRAAGAGSSRSNPLPVDSDDDMMMGDGDDHQPVYEQIDEDEDIVIPDSDEDDTVAQVERVARTAQEEEDAALAQRMQEELYRETGGGGTDGGGGLGGFVDEDGVRAPMARTTETLIGPDTVGPSIGLGRGGPSAWGTLGSHSPFFSDHSEVLRQLQHGRRGW